VIGGSARVGRVRSFASRLAVVVMLLVAGWVPAAPVGAAPREPTPGADGAAGRNGGEGGKPGFQIVDIDGLRGLLRRQRGRVVLLHFWASWCYPCLQELPLIDKFAHEMRPRGLELLSISLDQPGRMGPRVAALLRKSAPHLTPNIVQFDDADQLIALVDPRWAGAIPALFAYDHHGQLRGNLIGAASRAELDALVSGLLKAAAAEAPAVPAAPVAAPAPVRR
jgi:thiol-disulfide isomerase/thioredoxin